MAGVALLGWTGSGGSSEEGGPGAENVDIYGHVAGFLVGILLGAIAALPWCRRQLERIPQWLGGGLALGSILVAWAFALLS